MEPASASEWTVANAAVVVSDALQRLGLRNPPLKLLRHGENITFLAAGIGVIARLARPYADPGAVATEVTCATYLKQRDFPAGRLLESVDQPIATPLGLLTLWHRVSGRVGGDSDHEALGRLLRELHQLEPPPWLRPWDPLRKIAPRLREIRRQNVVPVEDVDFLEQLYGSLATEVTEVIDGSSDPRICHGDAHPGNVIVQPNGEAVLIDWEDCSTAPWEWDISEVLMAVSRFGLDQVEYSKFKEAYQQDIAASRRANVVLRLRELTATSWLLQNAAASPAVLHEGRLRISTMSNSSDHRTWSAF